MRSARTSPETRPSRNCTSSLVHTLGNLTLTGYNSTMSNKPFEVKGEQLHKSGLAMNQEIALESRWGRAEIHARASQLAQRIAKTWPGPVDVGPGDAGTPWDIMAKALAGYPCRVMDDLR